jgi:predicted transposase/invertase (TIGR01784 family)
MNPKVDIVFKKIFGSEENKDILKSFINSVLSKDEQISELVLKNPYSISDYKNGKMTILDIKATDEKGRLYDIEMQISEQGYFGQRALYYWGKTYTGQIDFEGSRFATLKKTVIISVLDFEYFSDNTDNIRYHRSVQAKDKDTNSTYNELDYFEMHFIELPKFTKKLSELKTTLDRWATFLNRAYEFEKDNIPAELSEVPEVKKAIESLDTIHLTKSEQEMYEAEKKKFLDEKEALRTAEEKGIEQGEIKGKIEAIKNMLAEGFLWDTIYRITQITEKEYLGWIKKK